MLQTMEKSSGTLRSIRCPTAGVNLAHGDRIAVAIPMKFFLMWPGWMEMVPVAAQDAGEDWRIADFFAKRLRKGG